MRHIAAIGAALSEALCEPVLRHAGLGGLAVAASLAFSATSAEAILLGVDATQDRLVTIDTTTGAATLGPLTAASLVSLAADSTGGLYGFNNTFFRRFGSIDPVTGSFTSITIFGSGSSVQGMSFNSADTLYGVENSADMLMTIDTVTGGQATIGATGFGLVTGVAFDPTDILYGYDAATDQLITIDTVTGAGTAVGLVGLGAFSIQGLAFVDGVLYAADVTNDQLVTIDTGTGAATVVGPTGTFNVLGLTNFTGVTPIPAAGATTLFALGAAGLAWRRRRMAA